MLDDSSESRYSGPEASGVVESREGMFDDFEEAQTVVDRVVGFIKR